jgi:hypothetical protein
VLKLGTVTFCHTFEDNNLYFPAFIYAGSHYYSSLTILCECVSTYILLQSDILNVAISVSFSIVLQGIISTCFPRNLICSFIKVGCVLIFLIISVHCTDTYKKGILMFIYVLFQKVCNSFERC